jgi:hypothetical protein
MNYPNALNYPHAPNHYAPNHYVPNHHAPNHHTPNHHAPNHHAPNHHAPNHHTPNHHAPNHHTPNHHAPNPHAPQLTRDYLTDGYISYTFGPQNAEGYIARLFSVDAPSIQAIRQGDAFYAFNHPSYGIPPAVSLYGRDAWLLDFAVIRSIGSVVPQQLWSPQGQGDRRRYVDQAQLRMPIFFINRDGSLGVPVMDAAAGNMQLRGVHLPPQLADKSTVKLRISVCTRSLRISHHLPYVLQWPCYNLPEQQVQLRDQTPQRNPISFERFVKHVGSRVRQYLLVRLSSMWR